MTSRFFTLSALILFLVCNLSSIAFAHGQGPGRVIDGKYLVILSLVPQGDAMHLRFLFRDTRTGRALADPTTGFVQIRDSETRVPLEERQFSTTEGRAEIVVGFPRDGIYSIGLTFTPAGTTEEIHESDAWEVRVPGKEDVVIASPLEVSELLTLAMGGVIVGFVFLGLIESHHII